MRFASSADASELARMQWELSSDEAAGQTWSEFRDAFSFTSWYSAALASARWRFAVAEAGTDDPKLVGFVAIQFVAGFPVAGEVDRGWAYLARAYVDPERRNGGLGSDLLGMVIGETRARGLELVIVWP